MGLVGLLLAAVASFGTAEQPAGTPPAEEPTYLAKPLSQWIVLAKDKDPAQRRKAAEAFGRIGAPAVPALKELLKDKDSGVRMAIVNALRYMSAEEPKATAAVLTKVLKDE